MRQQSRTAEKSRKSKETMVEVKVNVDGKGDYNITTKVPFFTHMLQMLAKHTRIDMDVEATGDLDHHVIEDTAILLGTAIREALGDMKGIYRFGQHYLPMDESLARCALDISGRMYYVGNLNLEGLDIEGMKVEDIDHFLLTFAQNLKANIHLEVLYGDNDHHKVEAALKALALSIRMAKRVDELADDDVPSTKGMLDTK
ncbi:MAG: imidazoleglycerol-phosphate dehydratase HisB [Candidatus Lokiarchaeota archaeon]|nr:imidazoleglycerol-phosphate dehydratase HisB [Candidatus Lokiarchaeota archaeon]